jgi:pSer/pThr/pTyr-binding forkhead associated (FHA) protein
VGAQSLRLDAAQLRIGRRDGTADSPEITGAADDPALSRRHALLRRADDGGYTIEDLGSTNGTEVNGRQLETGEVVTLSDGDRVYVGAWTAMTIRSRGV